MVSPSRNKTSMTDDRSLGFLTASAGGSLASASSSRSKARHNRGNAFSMNMNPRQPAGFNPPATTSGFTPPTRFSHNIPNSSSSLRLSELEHLREENRQLKDENEQLKDENEQLREQVASTHETSTLLPTGKNALAKRFKSATPLDKTNMAAVSVYVFHELWPHYKIFDFEPGWQCWGSPFCKFVMEGLTTEIAIPPGITEDTYWGTTIFPSLMKSVSDRRNNTQTRLKSVFETMYGINDHPKLVNVTGDARHLGCPFSEAKIVLHNFRQLVRAELLGLSSVDTTERSESIRSFMEFVDQYVVCMYGTQRLKALLKENRDKSVLDVITPEDIAYTILMVENGSATWQYNIEKKTNHGCSASSPPSSPYILPKSVHISAHHNNWTEPAQRYYQNLSKIMFQLIQGDSVLWEEITEGWDNFQEHNGTCGVSRYTKRQRIENPNTSSDAASAPSTNGFSLSFALPSLGDYYNPSAGTNDGMENTAEEEDDEEEEKGQSNSSDGRGEEGGGDGSTDWSDSGAEDVYPTNEEIDRLRRPELLDMCAQYSIIAEGTVPKLKQTLKTAFLRLRADNSLGTMEQV